MKYEDSTTISRQTKPEKAKGPLSAETRRRLVDQFPRLTSRDNSLGWFHCKSKKRNAHGLSACSLPYYSLMLRLLRHASPADLTKKSPGQAEAKVVQVL